MTGRLLSLPDCGQLMASTELHGDLEDLHALHAHFDRLRPSNGDVHRVLLGALIHEHVGSVDTSKFYVDEVATDGHGSRAISSTATRSVSDYRR